MPTDPQYAIVYTTFDGGYIKVGSCLSPDVTVGQKVLKVYDINPETGELTEHGEPRPKVTVEQVREVVERLRRHPLTTEQTIPEAIVDFIDNGPKKPTAEEVAQRAVEENTVKGKRYADIAVEALRKAGYLKDEA